MKPLRNWFNISRHNEYKTSWDCANDIIYINKQNTYHTYIKDKSSPRTYKKNIEQVITHVPLTAISTIIDLI